MLDGLSALTPKQRKFAENVMSGMNKTEAYIDAYDTTKMKRTSCTRKAQELLNNPKIKRVIDDFNYQYAVAKCEEMKYAKDELIADFMYLRDKSRRSIDENGVKQANSTAYINSLKNIGYLLNLYPDKRLDLKADLSSEDFTINVFDDKDNNNE